MEETPAMKPTTKAIDFSTMKGWDGLEAAEQHFIKHETAALAKALEVSGRAKLSVGEHLFKIQQILEPRRIFNRYLKTLPFGLSRATPYRYIDNYTVARTILPAPYMKVAMMRSTENLNVKMVEATPPPKTQNVTKINNYFDKLPTGGKLVEAKSETPDALKKDCYNYVHLRFQRLPNNGKTRAAWIHSLAGMLITEMGVSNPITVEPVAIPDDYRVSRGRPRKSA
jgi:hypothetical protein